MSTCRRKILKFAFDFYLDKGPGNAFLLDSLNFFNPSNRQFLSASNQLLTEELLCGIKTKDNNRVAVYANPEKIREIKNELDIWYRDSKFLITSSIALAGWVVALITLIAND